MQKYKVKLVKKVIKPKTFTHHSYLNIERIQTLITYLERSNHFKTFISLHQTRRSSVNDCINTYWLMNNSNCGYFPPITVLHATHVLINSINYSDQLNHYLIIISLRQLETLIVMSILPHTNVERKTSFLNGTKITRALDYLNMLIFWGLFVFLNRQLAFEAQTETSGIKIDQHNID